MVSISLESEVSTDSFLCEDSKAVNCVGLKSRSLVVRKFESSSSHMIIKQIAFAENYARDTAKITLEIDLAGHELFRIMYYESEKIDFANNIIKLLKTQQS